MRETSSLGCFCLFAEPGSGFRAPASPNEYIAPSCAAWSDSKTALSAHACRTLYAGSALQSFHLCLWH
jgi:hypothetical protein